MVYKKLFFFVGMLFFVAHAEFYANDRETNHVLTPHNTILLWDLHDVILQKDVPCIFRTIWRYNHTWDMLRSTNRPLIGNMIKLAYRALFEEGLGEKSIQLAYTHNNPFLADLIIKSVNAQRPIEGTVAIIKELHERGYQHHIGSNIAITPFKHLINPTEYPQLAHIFNYFDLDKSHVTSSTDTLDVKPHREYYTNYLKQNNIDLNKTTVIFIDDRIKNVEAARAVGMIGIHFKSPAQLRKDLHALGVDIAEQTPLASNTSIASSPCQPA